MTAPVAGDYENNQSGNVLILLPLILMGIWEKTLAVIRWWSMEDEWNGRNHGGGFRVVCSSEIYMRIILHPRTCYFPCPAWVKTLLYMNYVQRSIYKLVFVDTAQMWDFRCQVRIYPRMEFYGSDVDA